MHELSLCRGLLSQVSELAQHHGRDRVSRIVLRIGPLAGVETALLKQAFEVARSDTVARDAQLQIEESPLVIFCPTCQQSAAASLPRLDCPRCGNQQTTLQGGDELLLLSISFPEET